MIRAVVLLGLLGAAMLAVYHTADALIWPGEPVLWIDAAVRDPSCAAPPSPFLRRTPRKYEYHVPSRDRRPIDGGLT